VNATNVEFRRLLRSSGWHQARAAAALGLSTGTVSQYVHDKTVPSLTVLRLFGALIGEPVQIEGESPAAARQPVIREIWEEELIATIRRVPINRRRHVVESMRAVVTALDPEKTANTIDVNNSPLNPVGDAGRGNDPVLDRLERQASEAMDKIIAAQKRDRLIRGRNPKHAPPA